MMETNNPHARLYVTFNAGQAVAARRAIIPLCPTYEQALRESLKTLGIPLADAGDANSDNYTLKYGRTHNSGSTPSITWLSISPENWHLVSDGDDILLQSRESERAGSAVPSSAMESTATLVPNTNDKDSGRVDHDGSDAPGDSPKTASSTIASQTDAAIRPTVTYIYRKTNTRGPDDVAYASSFAPDTYEEAQMTAVHLLKQFTVGQNIDIESVALLPRILDGDTGKRVGVMVAREQWAEYVKNLAKKDTFCSVMVVAVGKR